MSPLLFSDNLKHREKCSSYFLLAVKRELLDLALQMQHPSVDLCTNLLCSEDMVCEDNSEIENDLGNAVVIALFFGVGANCDVTWLLINRKEIILFLISAP